MMGANAAALASERAVRTFSEVARAFVVRAARGTGKSHALAAICHALIDAGKRVLFTQTIDMVQRLQMGAARR